MGIGQSQTLSLDPGCLLPRSHSRSMRQSTGPWPGLATILHKRQSETSSTPSHSAVQLLNGYLIDTTTNLLARSGSSAAYLSARHYTLRADPPAIFYHISVLPPRNRKRSRWESYCRSVLLQEVHSSLQGGAVQTAPVSGGIVERCKTKRASPLTRPFRGDPACCGQGG